MGISAKVGAFGSGTGAVSSTVSVTGLGFQPKACIFWWSGATGSSDAVTAGSIRPGIGFATGATERICMSSFSLDAAAASDVGRQGVDDACIVVLADATTVDGALDAWTPGADGFDLTVDDQFATSYRIHYLALGGTDITNAKAGTWTLATATGNQSVTDPGFQPTASLFIGYTPLTLTTHGHGSFGFATDSTHQGVIGWGSSDAAATSNTSAYCYNGEILAPVYAGAIATRLAFVSNDATGFTVDRLEGTSAVNVGYLCLSGVSATVGDLLTLTNTTNDITESGLAFQPAAVMLISAGRPLDTQDTPTGDNKISIGAFTAADNEGAQGWYDQTSLADTETAHGVEHDASYLHVKDDALEASANCTAIASDGFTMRMVDADAAPCWVGYLALGAGVSTATGTLDQTLGDISATMAGVAAVNGALTGTLGGVTATIAGKVIITGRLRVGK